MTAATFALFASTGPACTYDFAIGGEPPDGGALALDAGREPEVDAGDGGSQATNDCEGASCACGEEEQCRRRCERGGCRATCDEARECDVSCSGGGCTVDCGGARECEVSCAGGNCTTRCGEGSSCEVSCAGGNCTTTCAPGARCTTRCPPGNCTCTGDGCVE